VAGRYRRPTTPAQREQSAQARENKLAGLHRTLTEQVTALAAGPAWRRWLDVAARFHTYSVNNTLLLLAQKPDATRVAGYTTWQQLGRQVTKGEKGLVILAPVIRRADPADTPAAAAGNPTTPAPEPAGADPGAPSRRVVGFRPAYVWDVAQTTGEPLPIPPRPQLLAGQAPPGLWDTLAGLVAERGFTVARGDCGGANGRTDYPSRTVRVRADVDDAQAVKTLAHELAHVLLHDPGDFPAGGTAGCRGSREVEAESVAYLIAADAGLDTADYTFAYVAGWAAETGDVEAALRASAARVLATAHQVLEATAAELAAPEPAADQLAAATAELAARTGAGAARTAGAVEDVTAPALPAGPDRNRLLAANAAAADYFAARYPDSWVPAYLRQRLGAAGLDSGAGADAPAGTIPRLGYAPAGWTELTEHLRGAGFTDDEILTAGLGTRARTGRVIDRFRDRLVLPIRAGGAPPEAGVVGFVGRRNPTADAAGDDSRTPKYLNTGHTPLYRKGEQLFGLAEAAATLDRGGVAVLVEGPLDALAVEAATGGSMAGIAVLGTALTEAQAGRLRDALGPGSDRVVVATDADPAGRLAAARAYTALTVRGLDPRAVELPPGLDPAALVELSGPAALADTLASAEPMGRQLVARTLDGRELRWAEDRVTAARDAARVLTQAPAATWPREIAAVSERTGLDAELLRTAVVDAVDTDTDALHRLTARDRRDDLDRGQHAPSTAADIAARSRPRTDSVPPAVVPVDQAVAQMPAPVAGAYGVRR
jgi:DNA primase